MHDEKFCSFYFLKHGLSWHSQFDRFFFLIAGCLKVESSHAVNDTGNWEVSQILKLKKYFYLNFLFKKIKF